MPYITRDVFNTAFQFRFAARKHSVWGFDAQWLNAVRNDAGGVGNLGTAFSVPVSGRTPTVLYNFDSTHGSHPHGDLTIDGSTLYGLTQAGGASDPKAVKKYGTVFSVTVSR